MNNPKPDAVWNAFLSVQYMWGFFLQKYDCNLTRYNRFYGN